MSGPERMALPEGLETRRLDAQLTTSPSPVDLTVHVIKVLQSGIPNETQTFLQLSTLEFAAVASVLNPDITIIALQHGWL